MGVSNLTLSEKGILTFLTFFFIMIILCFLFTFSEIVLFIYFAFSMLIVILLREGTDKTSIYDVQGESQNFCLCVHAANYKFVFIKNTAFSSR